MAQKFEGNPVGEKIETVIPPRVRILGDHEVRRVLP